MREVLSVTDVCDAELLERFVTSRDETAFAALMARHGPMVFGVCRRLLHHAQDAEDAFQAVFLILVRKAASIGKRDLLGNWLYGVAIRVASRARHTAMKRRTWETMDMERVAAATYESAEKSDLSAAITEEVQRLPTKYRGPVVLYYLEGRTSEEVANEMRCPLGTIKTRLNRARQILRKRLACRGLVLSTTAFSTALLAEAQGAALPPALIDSIINAAIRFAADDAAASGLVSVQTIALTKGVLHTMFMAKMKTAAVLMLALAVVLGGLSVFVYRILAEGPAPKKTDKDNIQGTWKVISAKVNGKVDDLEANLVKKLEFMIRADKVMTRLGDRSKEASYKIDPKAKPKTIDMIGEDGLTELGIYKLEADRLTICYRNVNHKERPKDFESKEGSRTVLIVFERVKK